MVSVAIKNPKTMTAKKRIRRQFSRVAMLLMMLLTAASGRAWTGSGKSSDPYKINNKSDLETLRANVNAGTNYNNTYFKQMDDIDLSGSNWTPIGTNEKPFKGHYDGNHKKITGLSISGSYVYAGLFGFITSEYDGASGHYRRAELLFFVPRT